MRKVDDLLQLFLDRIGQSDGAPYVGMFRGWRDIVGNRIADHAEPVDIRGTALVVEADHPGWVQMVLMSQSRILRQLNIRYPELKITALHIRVSDKKAAAAAATAERTRPNNEYTAPVAPVVVPSADETQALDRIEDTDLRDSLSSLRQALDGENEAEKDVE